MSKSNLTRRDLLKVGGSAVAVSALAGLAPGCQSSSENGSKAKTAAKPRNIIMLVADGMSMGVPAMAEALSRHTRNGQGTVWQKLMADPYTTHGYLHTESLSSMVTDSAAAASAWGSGSMIANGTLNMLPNGTRLMPIAASCKKLGIRTGLVTTDKITGATPAGFAAIQQKRENYEGIALDYLDMVDVLMGGGRRFFDPTRRSDRQDVRAMFATRGYTDIDDRDALLASKQTSKVLGLFAENTMPYTLDHQRDGHLRQYAPTLEEMTRTALVNLSHNTRGFLVQIEGARVDHACHANDAAAALWDQIAFDDAVRAALQFAQDDGRTLVIVTTDHATANPGLNGMGKRYNDSTDCFARLAGINGSFDSIRQHVIQAKQDMGQTKAIAVAVEQGTGVKLTDDEAELLADAMFDKAFKNETLEQHRNFNGMLGQVLANHTGIAFTGMSHTADHVLLSAWGPGSQAFAGIHHHTDLHRIMTGYLGITHENPKAAAV